jgi:hypothetical protein
MTKEEEYDLMVRDTLSLIDQKVTLFSVEIKETLRKNVFIKGKGSWLGVPKEVLISKLFEEVNELIVALDNNDGSEILLEATDVAAVAMMLRDNFGVKTYENKN